MNHIEMFESLVVDYSLEYEIRSMIRNLHNMKMDEMLQARELMNRFVDKKQADYMLICINDRNKAQI